MSDRDSPGTIALGAGGVLPRHVQEWPCLRGFGVVIDGRFGLALVAKTAGRRTQ